MIPFTEIKEQGVSANVKKEEMIVAHTHTHKKCYLDKICEQSGALGIVNLITTFWTLI